MGQNLSLPSGGAGPADALLSDFGPLELSGDKPPCVSAQLAVLVQAALRNSHSQHGALSAG